MPQPVVLIVGSSDLSAGVDCASVLADLAPTCIVEHVADLAAARDYLLNSERHAELVVLCESRRGQLSSAVIEALRRAAPLVRFWRVLGSWHEGEPRSGRPPAGCTSTYWHQWPARTGRAIAAGDSAAVWKLPLTASPDERVLAETSELIEQRSGVVVVCASRFESAMALADVCRLGGYDAAVVRDGATLQVEDSVAVVWDTTSERVGDSWHVEKLRSSVANAPIIAVVGFPRADDVRRAHQAGVAAVVSKPYLVRDVLCQVHQAAEK